MWEPLTKDCRDAIVLAVEEASLQNCNFIGSEHILAGLVHISKLAKDILGDEVTVRRVRDEIFEITGASSSWPPSKKYIEKSFTPIAKNVIELAFKAASENKESEINAKHFIIGLIKTDGVGKRVLENILGINFSKLLKNIDYNIIEKGKEKEMNITFTMPGTNLKVTGPVEEAHKLYASKPTNEWPNELKEALTQNGDFYFSVKLGLLKVEDMNTPHLRNAVLKLYKEDRAAHTEALRAKNLKNRDLVEQLNMFPENKTLVKMMFVLSNRADV